MTLIEHLRSIDKSTVVHNVAKHFVGAWLASAVALLRPLVHPTDPGLTLVSLGRAFAENAWLYQFFNTNLGAALVVITVLHAKPAYDSFNAKQPPIVIKSPLPL